MLKKCGVGMYGHYPAEFESSRFYFLIPDRSNSISWSCRCSGGSSRIIFNELIGVSGFGTSRRCDLAQHRRYASEINGNYAT